MASEQDLALLDDYLMNRLQGSEKSAFEARLSIDPDLKNEYELQQQLIHGIQKARMAELKSMLNNVPVPAAQGGSVAAGKLALWTVIAALVGTGIYLYFDTSTEQPVETATQNQTTPPPTNKETQPLKEEKKEEQTVKPHEDSPVVSAERASSEQKPANLPKPIRKSKEEKNGTSSRAVEVFDPTAEQEENKAPETIEKNVAAPEHKAISVEVDSENKKYTFNYQFRDGKLLLYGPFEKNLYEIMEFFNDDKRTLFLYYKDNYYLLKDDNEKLKPLNAIQDPTLIKKLKEYRKDQ